MSEHSFFSPSSAARWVACPGSLAASARYPEVSGEAAAEGTLFHACVEALLNDLPTPTDARVDMVEHAQACARFVRNVSDGALYTETRIVVPAVHDRCFGTCDAFNISSGLRVSLFDYKYGFSPVDPFENWQGLIYAAGVAELAPDVTQFEFFILQPRAYHRDGPFRSWRFSRSELNERIRHVRAAAEDAASNNPTLSPGSHCRYCPARRGCPALRAATLATVDMMRGGTTEDLPLPALGAELTLLARAAELLEYRMAGLQAQAMSEIQGGKTVPGWQIDHAAGREKWTKPASEVIMLGSLLGVDLAKPAEPITPAQARKAGVPAELMTGYTARDAGAAKLAPVDNKAARKAFKQEN